jgi:hypothetical protein
MVAAARTKRLYLPLTCVYIPTVDEYVAFSRKSIALHVTVIVDTSLSFTN